jgi:CobQ-like glutamine amidotransferase family enzyme
MTPRLRLLALYPDQMNIYADRGNILLLRRRCEWRGIGFEQSVAGPGESFDPADHDLVYIGGGQDRDQRLVAEDMRRTKRHAIAAAVEDDAVVLAVCGGYQLLGHSYQLAGERIAGLGIADLETIREPGKRLIGNVEIEAGIGAGGAAMSVAGFENHGGRTYLGAGTAPLGRVIRGHGNNGRDGSEGVRGGPRGTVVGTYIHGPLLPKNTAFADWLTATALDVEPDALAALDDTLEAAAHRAARRAAGA